MTSIAVGPKGIRSLLCVSLVTAALLGAYLNSAVASTPFQAVAIIGLKGGIEDHHTQLLRRLISSSVSVSANFIETDLVDPSTLEKFSAIYLYSSWCNNKDFPALEAKAAIIKGFVEKGGGLIVEQPNPYDQPGGKCRPTILPYLVTFDYQYFARNLPNGTLYTEHWSYVADADHAITLGLGDDDMPSPYDDILEYDARYKVLARSKYDDRPTLLVAEYGLGRIVIHTGNSHPRAGRILRSITLARIVRWAIKIPLSDTLPPYTEEIAYDDGSSETALTMTIASNATYCRMYATKFSSSLLPFHLVGARFYIADSPADFNVRVLGSDRTFLGEPVLAKCSVYGWLEVDLASQNIVLNEDFYIAVEFISARKPMLGADTSSSVADRSYWIEGPSASRWGTYRDLARQFGVPAGNFMIRALIKPPPFKVSVTVSGLPSYLFLNVTVDGVSRRIASQNTSFQFPYGTNHTMAVEPIVYESDKIRYYCDDNSATVSSEGALVFRYSAQYLVSVISDLGTSAGSGWYGVGQSVDASVDREEIWAEGFLGLLGVRYIFSGWRHDSTTTLQPTLAVEAPMTFRAVWKTDWSNAALRLFPIGICVALFLILLVKQRRKIIAEGECSKSQLGAR